MELQSVTICSSLEICMAYAMVVLSFILGAIKGEGLSDVVCVVVRYFGTFRLPSISPVSCRFVGKELV